MPEGTGNANLTRPADTVGLAYVDTFRKHLRVSEPRAERCRAGSSLSAHSALPWFGTRSRSRGKLPRNFRETCEITSEALRSLPVTQLLTAGSNPFSDRPPGKVTRQPAQILGRVDVEKNEPRFRYVRSRLISSCDAMLLHHNLDHVGLIEGAAASVGRGCDLPPAQRPWPRIWIQTRAAAAGAAKALEARWETPGKCICT